MDIASVADIGFGPQHRPPGRRDQDVLVVAQGIAAELAVVAGQQSERTRIEAAVIGGGTVLILLIAGWAALTIGSSMVRRVRTVTRAAPTRRRSGPAQSGGSPPQPPGRGRTHLLCRSSRRR